MSKGGFCWRSAVMRGSVFIRSCLIALPCAVLAAVFKLLQESGHVVLGQDLTMEGKVFSGFAALLGFVIVFRTSLAYSRFWSGCTATHQMRAEWVDAASLIMSFVRVSKGNKDKLAEFQGTLVRLFSMLHAVALAELEDINQDAASLDDILGFKYKLIDPEGVDEYTLRKVKLSDSKVELLYTWIQMIVTESIDGGVLSLAPPLQTRVFTSLSNGMLSFFDAVKITACPFPFPYTQTCNFLLLIHWAASPFVITQWVSNAYLAAICVFVQVFTLWALNHIASEIQNPFGAGASELDGFSMQEEMNRHLLLLTASETQSLPRLAPTAMKLQGLRERDALQSCCNQSLLDVWSQLAEDGQPVPEPARKGQVYRRAAGLHSVPYGNLPGKCGAHRMLKTVSHGVLSPGLSPAERELQQSEDSSMKKSLGDGAEPGGSHTIGKSLDFAPRSSVTSDKHERIVIQKMFSDERMPADWPLLVPKPQSSLDSVEFVTVRRPSASYQLSEGPEPEATPRHGELYVPSPRSPARQGEPHVPSPRASASQDFYMPPLQSDWSERAELQVQLQPSHFTPCAVLKPVGDKI